MRLSLPKASAIEAARAEAKSERGAIGSTGCEAIPLEGKAVSHQAACDIEPASSSAQEKRSARGAFPLAADEAMIREVHVYGAVAALGHASTGAQHAGLGRKLVARACEIAREAGYERINVISAVGTREYYATLGFEQHGLYQQKEL